MPVRKWYAGAIYEDPAAAAAITATAGKRTTDLVHEDHEVHAAAL